MARDKNAKQKYTTSIDANMIEFKFFSVIHWKFVKL